MGRSARETLIRAIKSPHFAEGALARFLHGSDRNDRRLSLQLSEKVVARERARLLREALPRAELDNDPSAADFDMPALGWRHALFLFWSGLGGEAKPLIDWVVRSSETGARLGPAFAEAVERLTEIDHLVAAGARAEAFLAARRGTESGLTCFATRRLALGLALCSDAASATRLLAEAKPLCAPEFVAHAAHLFERRLLSEEVAAPLTSDQDTAAGLGFHLPAIYADPPDLPTNGNTFAAALGLWSTLSRPEPVLGQARQASFATSLRLAMGAVGAERAVIEAATAVARDAGAQLILVGVAPEAAPQGVAVASSFAEARRAALAEDDAGEAPTLLLDHVVAPPPAVLRALLQTVTSDTVLPVVLDRLRFDPARPLLSAASGRDSRLIGLFGRRGTVAWTALKAAGDQPATAAVAAKGLALQLFEADERKVEDAGADASPITLVLGRRSEAEPTARRLELPSAASSAEAARALRETAEAHGWAADAPVVLLAADLDYDLTYPTEIAKFYERLGRFAPVAVRGLRADAESGEIAFASDPPGAAVHRAAPIVLSCLACGEALAALEAAGTLPAAEMVVLFSAPAVGWPEGTSLVRGPWSQRLKRWNADLEGAQQVFARGRASLATELMADPDRPPSRLPPYMSWLRKREAAARGLADAARTVGPPRLDIDGLYAFLEDGGAMSWEVALTALANDRLAGLTTSQLRELLGFAQACGAQSTVARALALSVPVLAAADPYKIGPLFDFLAGGVEAETFSATLVAALALEVRRDTPRAIHVDRLLTAASAHAASETLPVVLRMVDEAAPTLLFRLPTDLGSGTEPGPSAAPLDALPEAAAALGERLLFSPSLRLDLPRSGLGSETLAALAGAEPRLSRAALAGDRAGVIEAVRALADASGDLRSAREVLQSVAGEVSRLSITAHDWPYPTLGDATETLAVATILGDHETLALWLNRVEMPALHAVAARALGDPRPLEALYAGWAHAARVRPLPLGGDTLVEVYDRVLADPTPAAAARPDTPLVSVIMTAFNADTELLVRALTSVLNQSWPHVEVLLVDDGSAPEARAAAEARVAHDPRVRFFEVGRNLGPYVGRNLALRRARGAFIAIQDADDLSHPQRFERQLELLASHPEAAACASSQMRLDAAGRTQLQNGMEATGDGTMTTMFRREVFDRLGPFTETRSRGDVEYRQRIRKALGPAAHREIDCPLVLCYAAAGTLSNAVTREKGAALRQFRTAFRRRRWLWDKATGAPRPLGELAVPFRLRP